MRHGFLVAGVAGIGRGIHIDEHHPVGIEDGGVVTVARDAGQLDGRGAGRGQGETLEDGLDEDALGVGISPAVERGRSDAVGGGAGAGFGERAGEAAGIVLADGGAGGSRAENPFAATFGAGRGPGGVEWRG